MARSIDRKFYETPRWRKCKKAYLESVGGLCERCRQKGRLVPAYIVHHKVHLNNDNVNDASIAYGFDNLEALCIECHNQEHFKEKIKRRYRIGDDGDLGYLPLQVRVNPSGLL